MKESCFLPIVAPEFVCFDYFTCANAVVRANAKEHQRLVMSTQYINCYYKAPSGNRKFVISTFDPWCEKQGLMQNQAINFLKEVYRGNEEELISTIKTCLLGGCYLFGYCNRKYIETDAQNATALLHYVATGFDDIKREFTIYGLNCSEQFVCFRVKYQTFVDALLDTDKPSVVFTMWRYNRAFSPSLQLPTIAGELKNYVSSTHSKEDAESVFGLRAMEEMAVYFLERARRKSALKMSYLQQLVTHKKYMKNRIDYLAESGIIDPKWREKAEAINAIGRELIDLGNRFQETHDLSCVQKLTDGILRTVEIESAYLPRVLQEIFVFS